jgi:hypothetical protein
VTTSFKIQLTPESRKALAGLRKRLDGDEIAKDVVKHFTRDALRVRRTIVERGLSGPTGPTTRSRRTGELARSVEGIGTFVDGLPAIQVGSFRLAYARMQLGDETTRILPKRAKALAFPVGKALTAAGRPRFPRGPRTFPRPLQFVPFKRKGNIIGALYERSQLQREGKRARKKGEPVSLRNVQALWLLARQSSIKGSGALRRGFEEQLPGIVSRLSTQLTAILQRRLRRQ